MESAGTGKTRERHGRERGKNEISDRYRYRHIGYKDSAVRQPGNGHRLGLSELSAVSAGERVGPAAAGGLAGCGPCHFKGGGGGGGHPSRPDRGHRPVWPDARTGDAGRKGGGAAPFHHLVRPADRRRGGGHAAAHAQRALDPDHSQPAAHRLDRGQDPVGPQA